MKILVISFAGNGDTLMATPLIHELRANFPDAVIDAFVRWPAARDLLQNNPHLNTVYQKDLLRCGKLEAWNFLGQLRRNRYDISLNTHPQSRVHYRIVARLINARLRISHEYDHTGMVDRLLVNRTVKQDYQRHCLENNLALLPLAGAKPLLARHEYELFFTPAERQWADDFITREKLGPLKRLGLHIGSGGTKNLALRRWPLENYLALIKKLNQTRTDLAILLFGGPEEESGHARLLAECGPRRVMAPPTKNIREAAALIGKCDLFISVDTALMHLAAAMKVPHQMVIETPTFNRTVEPWGNRFVTIKNPAVEGRNLDYYRYDGAGIRGTAEELTRCMAAVSVEEVYQAVVAAATDIKHL